MPQRPAEAVELPNDQGIARLQLLEEFAQLGALQDPAGLVDEDSQTPCFFEGIQLQVGILVCGRDPGRSP